MSIHPSESDTVAAPLWSVGALCRVIADHLDARFNPVRVTGELIGFTRASSGHCYFTLRDSQGQLRCALFRRAAEALLFTPRDGDRVELSGRLGVYEARGDLQLVVDRMDRAGQGVLLEQFLRLKAALHAEGLFDAARKRPLAPLPRCIGVVASPGSAAWHDIMTALRRRAPHIPVLLAPALVQGADAPADLMRALSRLYARTASSPPDGEGTPVDTIILARGGGAPEDLWAFNDEALARCIARSPVPLVSGIGHETDFTMADFVADVRAPTPTAAAELAAITRQAWLDALFARQERLSKALTRYLDTQAQQLDMAALRLGRPSAHVARQRLALERLEARLRHAVQLRVHRMRGDLDQRQRGWPEVTRSALERLHRRLERIADRLPGVDPRRVLEQGYAWLSDADGHPLTRAAAIHPGQPVRATLVDGMVELKAAERSGR